MKGSVNTHTSEVNYVHVRRSRQYQGFIPRLSSLYVPSGNTTLCQHTQRPRERGYIWIYPNCYYLHGVTRDLKTWYEARNDCIKRGGDLTVLDTDTKRTSLEQRLPTYLTAWIGLSKVRIGWTSGKMFECQLIQVNVFTAHHWFFYNHNDVNLTILSKNKYDLKSVLILG